MKENSEMCHLEEGEARAVTKNFFVSATTSIELVQIPRWMVEAEGEDPAEAWMAPQITQQKMSTKRGDRVAYFPSGVQERSGIFLVRPRKPEKKVADCYDIHPNAFPCESISKEKIKVEKLPKCVFHP